jgi:hypothetical protein
MEFTLTLRNGSRLLPKICPEELLQTNESFNWGCDESVYENGRLDLRHVMQIASIPNLGGTTA